MWRLIQVSVATHGFELLSLEERLWACRATRPSYVAQAIPLAAALRTILSAAPRQKPRMPSCVAISLAAPSIESLLLPPPRLRNVAVLRSVAVAVAAAGAADDAPAAAAISREVATLTCLLVRITSNGVVSTVESALAAVPEAPPPKLACPAPLLEDDDEDEGRSADVRS